MSMDPASKSPTASGEQQGKSQFALLKTRRFGPFFLSQLLGAFNDALLTTTLAVLLASPATGWTAPAPESLGTMAAALLAFPFVMFAATAGQLADKYDRATLARLAKLIEILTMGIAALGLLMHSASLLLGALCLLGLRSTLFVPVKYAILPQHLHDDELVGGNALVETGSVVALLTGALAGALLAGVAAYWMVVAGTIVATAGFAASLAIPGAPAANPGLIVRINPVSETWRNIGLARQDRKVFRAILGISAFWLYGALLLAQFAAYSRNVPGAAQSTALLLGALATGIAVGSLLCTMLSGKQLEIGLLSFAAMGQAFFALDLFFALPAAAGTPFALTARLSEPGFGRIMFDLCALGVFFGLFIVPLKVLIQLRSAAQERARVLCTASLLNALAVLAGVFMAAGLPATSVTLASLFALAAIGLASVAVYAFCQEAHLSLRFLTDLLIHSFYRLGKKGFEHIPKTGPAVLVCNHVSFVDSLVIMAAIRRPIRFVIDHRIHRTPVAAFLFRHSRTIPIATAKENPELKEAAFDEVARALKNGELIGLFPEGGITHTGEIKHFRYGVGRIVSETPVPVIPMALRGLWGSFFSRRYGPAMSKPSLLRLFARIELVVGDPVPAEKGSPEYLQEIVSGLRGDLL
jgi:1-acyl-sn-glycerol-3-phosphate acyltransferase